MTPVYDVSLRRDAVPMIERCVSLYPFSPSAEGHRAGRSLYERSAHSTKQVTWTDAMPTRLNRTLFTPRLAILCLAGCDHSRRMATYAVRIASLGCLYSCKIAHTHSAIRSLVAPSNLDRSVPSCLLFCHFLDHFISMLSHGLFSLLVLSAVSTASPISRVRRSS